MGERWKYVTYNCVGNFAVFETEDEDIRVDKSNIAKAFKDYGGSFVKCLGMALDQADMENSSKLIDTWRDYVEKYFNQFILPDLKKGRKTKKNLSNC